jgi:hypothetical protein
MICYCLAFLKEQRARVKIELLELSLEACLSLGLPNRSREDIVCGVVLLGVFLVQHKILQYLYGTHEHVLDKTIFFPNFELPSTYVFDCWV